ncbi:putative metallo-hydrolase YflN [compost metagenome]
MTTVAPGVYHLPLFFGHMINCYIADGFLIDAGIRSSFSKILKAVQTLPIEAHVLTHAHPDHQGSSHAICTALGIPLWCSAPEQEQAASGKVTGEYPSPRHLIPRWQQQYWAGPGHPVARTLKENDRIGTFTVIETPGHSSGHLSFFREEDGTLILGDVATNIHLLTGIRGLHLPPGLFTKDKELNICSLKKLAQLHPRTICFGHGPVLRNDKSQFEHFAEKL